jgi:alpha-N-arabinofuranosidase
MKRFACFALVSAQLLFLSTRVLSGQTVAQEAVESGVRVTREPLCAGTISPMQYGQFVEYLCDLVPAMWAEKLWAESFEGLSPYNFVFLRETDFKQKPWYPSGEVNRAQVALDTNTVVSGAASKRITIEAGAPATAGISQDGIFLERGQPCNLTIWLRARGVTGPVRMRLHHEAKVYATWEFNPGEEWKKFSARLVPAARDVNATLSIEFRGPGTLWLDNASLMPLDTIGGWRSDVVAAVHALQPGVIRFGGSAVDAAGYGDFDWKKTIGDPDLRRPFRAWGGLQPTGPGLEEFVEFCRTVGAEPLICVRFNQRTPRDAADEVEYFNGVADTPMGALRAKNGHPQPYAVKYWQVGNEIQSADYDARLGDFCRAMKKADPAIKLLSSYPTPASLKSAGQWLDYTCPHHYGCGDLAAMENDFAHVRELLRENAPGRAIEIGVTEWNTTAGDAGPRRAMLWTLANALACSRYHNLLHRQCDLVEIANRSNLINSFCSGIIQTDNHRLYKTPTYYAQQLYATLAGNRPLRIASANPANTGLDLSATLSAKGDEVVLFAVNDNAAGITRPLDFSAFGATGQSITVWTLTDRQHAGEPDVVNSFAEPERVAPMQATFRARSLRFDYSFPPLSLTVLRWKIKSN